MLPSSRTPEGHDNTCPICGQECCIDPTIPPGDAPCPHCGSLLWFQGQTQTSESPGETIEVALHELRELADGGRAWEDEIRRVSPKRPVLQEMEERLAAMKFTFGGVCGLAMSITAAKADEFASEWNRLRTSLAEWHAGRPERCNVLWLTIATSPEWYDPWVAGLEMLYDDPQLGGWAKGAVIRVSLTDLRNVAAREFTLQPPVLASFADSDFVVGDWKLPDPAEALLPSKAWWQFW